jgi:hypothetical protein
MIEMKGVTIQTQIQDFTVGQFELATAILNDDSISYVERYLDVLEAFKVPEELIDSLTDDELFEIIKSFQETGSEIPKELKRTIEIDGYVYSSFPEESEFNLKAKDLSLIQKAFSNKKGYFSEALSILFKREDLSNKEHYASAHLKHKKDLFKVLPAIEYYTYIVWITQKLTEKIKNLNVNTQQVTEQLESNND